MDPGGLLVTYQNVRALAQRITLGATDVFQDVPAATLCAWFLVDSVSAAVRVLSSVSTGASSVNPRLEVAVNTATPRTTARRLDADATTTLNAGAVTAATKHHLAAVAQFVILALGFRAYLTALPEPTASSATPTRPLVS